MNIYVAGPMRGIPEFNFPAFHAATALLRGQGHVVFSPAERDENEFGPVSSPEGDEKVLAKAVFMSVMGLRRRVFAADMEWICKHADAIYMLGGWENSKGALAEIHLADALGLEIIYQ